MAYTVFYVSVVVVWIMLFICIYYKPLHLSIIIIGISSAAYSLIYDITFGDRAGLYYYVKLNESTLFMLLGALLLYPVLNMMFTLFLPDSSYSVLVYSALWMGAMLLFEYICVKAGTIVFTGWRAVPWSIVTYFVTYTWINLFYKYLRRRIQ